MTNKEKNTQYLAHIGLQLTNPPGYNLSNAGLVEDIIYHKEGVLSHTGAVIVETGVHTGRSPNDKYIVNNASLQDDQIEWGKVNKAISPEGLQSTFRKGKRLPARKKNRNVQDVIAGRDPKFARTFRVVSEFAWATLFSRDLLLPTVLEEKVDPDFTLIHVPHYFADPDTDHTKSGTFIIINFEKRIVLIGGSSYAGEIKKSVFTVMNRIT